MFPVPRLQVQPGRNVPVRTPPLNIKLDKLMILWASPFFISLKIGLFYDFFIFVSSAYLGPIPISPIYLTLPGSIFKLAVEKSVTS